MEKYFGNAYRGDPGVPHADPDRFENIWIGSFVFSALTWKNPYMWTLSNQYNWHDKAMLYEQYHWKKALEQGKPYKFLWNQIDREIRDYYYFNWPLLEPIGWEIWKHVLYWKEKVEDASIEAAVIAIGTCLRPIGSNNCSEVL